MNAIAICSITPKRNHGAAGFVENELNELALELVACGSAEDQCRRCAAGCHVWLPNGPLATALEQRDAHGYQPRGRDWKRAAGIQFRAFSGKRPT